MILYTFQTIEAWNNAHSIGKFIADPKEVCKQWSNWSSILEANAYMRSKMYEKLKFSGYPMWTWLKKPDLRSYGCKDQICFKIDIPAERCLISNFNMYNFVINNDYLSLSEKEYTNFDAIQVTPTEKEHSWRHIFDLDLPKNKLQARWLGSKENQIYQVCVDEIYISEIVKVIRWPKIK